MEPTKFSNRKVSIILVAFFLLAIFSKSILAEEKYTYEKAEALKPLINWYDYGPDAFSDALAQNKPIFLLLTAPSWCYWCQVYESEDYLFHPAMIKLINEKFIPVYVDADQRSDLTRDYLEGGWPSTTIFTPTKERLYGYSGPRPVSNMIENLNSAANFVSESTFQNSIVYNYQPLNVVILGVDSLQRILNDYSNGIFSSFDQTHGGFGGGQKFPQGRALDWALDLYEETGNSQWLELVETSLNNQYTKIDELKTNYNLFDPIDGGFHRYGTKRDWTPPHYEKMLYDNARLLKAYYHLSLIDPTNEIATEVVEKTLTFIQNNWLDSSGGFYGNSDVHGEDAYYGENPRSDSKPRVEKTKYTDWNSDAIFTYLYLYEKSNDEKYKSIAVNALDFYKNNMISDEGTYHFITFDGVKGVRGGLLDNAYLALAFIEGYEILNDPSYLEASKKIIDYSLNNLYDWNSSGFFERNSPDKELYALGDHIKLSRPDQENGVMNLALLKLHMATDDVIYLGTGIKSMSSIFSSYGGLDRGYYQFLSIKYALENGLVEKFVSNQEEFLVIENDRKINYWLNSVLAESDSIPKDFEASDIGLVRLQAPIFLLILIAFIAGFISFVSPCTLPILPAYLAYAFRSSKKNIKLLTIFMFLGLTSVFTILGMSATLLGSYLRENLAAFTQIAGIAIIFFGLYIIWGGGFSGIKIKQKKPTTFAGSFLFGGVLGLSWTPCIGPILVAILLLASTTTSYVKGGLLLFSYGAGLALPLIFISIYLEKINKNGKIWKFIEGRDVKINLFGKQRTFHTSSLISGIIFLILGIMIFSGVLYSINQYFSASGFQKIILNVEEVILGWIT